MDNPIIILGIVVSTLYGAVFHLLKGGSLGRLVFYILLAWAGFWLGQYIATEMEISIYRFGTLNLIMATLFSFAFLFFGHWLSLIDHGRNDSTSD
jgi:hypothetical protein